jgi:CubicO group peptidase (beta-lactamase class C family)
MEAITGADLQSEPGRFWAYSNEGFATLGHIVEKISGIRLEEYFLTKVFEPLGMTDTRVHLADWRAASDRTVNYIREELGEKADGAPHGKYQPGFLPEDYQTYLSTGGIVSTAHDLALYQAAAMNYDGSPVLGRDALEQMQNTAFEYGDTNWGYGFGWSVFWSGDTRVVGHAGGMVGLNTFSLFVPDEQIGAVVVTNRSEAGAFELAEKLLGEVRGTPLWRDSTRKPLPFETNYAAPTDESPSAFDGDYAHGDVVTRIAGIDGGINLKLIRNGVEVFEDVATRVGPESFLSRNAAQIMQFNRDEDGQGATLFEAGLLWQRVSGS